MNASLAVVPQRSKASRPDISWIKKYVPILQVARLLDMRVVRGWAKCWRPENHRHGDANPTLHFHRNRVRCFVCDEIGGHSNIDLVMGVLDTDLLPALTW